MTQIRSPSASVAALEAERRRCTDIIRKAAGVYREMAKHATSTENHLGYRAVATALEDVANEIEDI